jgi:hypothetical protein
MKKLCPIIIACTLILTTGCSVLISTPPVARIQIHGLNNQTNVYIVALDAAPTQSTIDIRITDRYAINLDFQWLLGSNSESEMELTDDHLTQKPPIIPWMMCTYRF